MQTTTMTDNQPLPTEIFTNRVDADGALLYWDTAAVHDAVLAAGVDQALRSTERALEQMTLLPAA
ncbi:MAG: hypothetical protein ACJA2J_002306, partial [Candidatus Azotimanducaceae bacterium]